jgi:3-isopropylmalate/(R)-2-methylmalate dehydratase small subunit
MLKFDVLTAVAAPLLRANVDTDAIIPSREMKSVSKTGLAAGLFAGWRYTQIGGREPDPDFVLNQPDYAGARVLLAGENFGCGSSREHAVWALLEFGIRAIVAPSFAPIFRMNCVRNGILPACLPAATISELAESVAVAPQVRQVTVDLARQVVSGPNGAAHAFAIDLESREMLLEGLDAIDLTLKQRGAIDAFTEADRALRPWIYLLQ